MPSFEIWCRAKTGDAQWERTPRCLSYRQAVEVVNKWVNADYDVYMTEEVTHRVNGNLIKEGLLVFWTDTLNDYTRGKPVGRGFGYSQELERLIHYDFEERSPAAPNPPKPPREIQPYRPPARQPAPPLKPLPCGVEVIPSRPPEVFRQSEPEPDEDYLTLPCDRCGRIQSQADLKWHSHEVKAGSTSGVRRNRSSTAWKSGVRSGSITQRQGTSYTSGRTIYKAEALLLCEPCLKTVKGEDRLRTTGRFISWLFR